MGLRAAFQNGAKALFAAFDDVPFNITYKVFTAGAAGGRGAVSGTLSSGSTVEAFVVSYNNKEVMLDGGLIAPGDRKVIIEKRVLDALSVTPKKSDQMVIESDTFKVINISPDPSASIYIFQVRQV